MKNKINLDWIKSLPSGNIVIELRRRKAFFCDSLILTWSKNKVKIRQKGKDKAIMYPERLGLPFYRYSQGKTIFYSIQYKNGWLAASDLFYMFTQSVKFYTFYYHTFKEFRCLKNVIHEVDSKNEWLLLSSGFTAKFWLVFVLTLKNAFL